MGAPIFKSADELLVDLGITEPQDLDVEAIAQHCCATIVYKPLKGCAARITGNEERAIITIDSECRRERQRFSAWISMNWATGCSTGENPLCSRAMKRSF